MVTSDARRRGGKCQRVMSLARLNAMGGNGLACETSV